MSSSYDMFNPVSDPFEAILNPNTGNNAIANFGQNNNFFAQNNQGRGANWGDDVEGNEFGEEDGRQDLGGGTNDMYEGGGSTPQSDPLYDEPEGGNYQNDWEPPIEYDPPVFEEDDWWDPPTEDDPYFEPDFEMPDFEMPDFEMPDFDMPEIDSPDIPEEEEEETKRPNIGFYDVDSASAGFRSGEIEHDPNRLFAGQVAGKIGRNHPLERALFGR